MPINFLQSREVASRIAYGSEGPGPEHASNTSWAFSRRAARPNILSVSCFRKVGPHVTRMEQIVIAPKIMARYPSFPVYRSIAALAVPDTLPLITVTRLVFASLVIDRGYYVPDCNFLSALFLCLNPFYPNCSPLGTAPIPGSSPHARPIKPLSKYLLDLFSTDR